MEAIKPFVYAKQQIEIMKILLKLAQGESDESVQWNEHNKVVQSHKDGTLYLSVDNAVLYGNDQIDSCIGFVTALMPKKDGAIVDKELHSDIVSAMQGLKNI